MEATNPTNPETPSAARRTFTVSVRATFDLDKAPPNAIAFCERVRRNLEGQDDLDVVYLECSHEAEVTVPVAPDDVPITPETLAAIGYVPATGAPHTYTGPGPVLVLHKPCIFGRGDYVVAPQQKWVATMGQLQRALALANAYTLECDTFNAPRTDGT